MNTIRTVGGDIAPSSARGLLPHEHIVVHTFGDGALPAAYRRNLDRLVRRDMARLLAAGCNTLVELTPEGDGRDPLLYRALSQQSGMHIVMCTGAYVEASIPAPLRRRSTDALAARMRREIEVGVGDTGIRAGVIKLASQGSAFGRTEQRMFQAAADVTRLLGVPISTHCASGVGNQVGFFLRARVPPSRVTLGHVEVAPWPDICRAAEKGFWLCFTNFGGEAVMAEAVMLAQVATLVRRGYIRQILLSNDFAYFARRGRLIPHFPVACDYLSRTIRSKLARQGLKPAAIERILEDNPRRALAF